METVFITGISSGIGYALTKEYLSRNYRVFAIGRNSVKEFESDNFNFLKCDLEDINNLEKLLPNFIKNIKFDIAILNAGIHGGINNLQDTDMTTIHKVMNINVWANKIIIDNLSEHSTVKQIVGMSSGAAVNGSKGWGPYSLSKASLNMLLNLYSKETLSTHFTALAPGVIDTPMVQNILENSNKEIFPSIQRLQNGPINNVDQAVSLLINSFPKLLNYESGSFLDIRTMA